MIYQHLAPGESPGAKCCRTRRQNLHVALSNSAACFGGDYFPSALSEMSFRHHAPSQRMHFTAV